MIRNKIDSIEFRLRELHDFDWLKKYGTAFWAVDETGSGCICIGMEKADKKYFCKIAGVNTIEADVLPKESIEILKEAVHLYQDLRHSNLVKLIEAYDYNEFYVAVFEWVEGECLFIDLFRKAPAINDRGEEWFGTKRLKAPEEYIKGSVIDEQTNIFTLGALIFEFFGCFTDDEIKQRYCNNQFLPCPYSNWQLNKESYQAAVKAVKLDKNERYRTFDEFFTEWKTAGAMQERITK